jgi:hypothetical protein
LKATNGTRKNRLSSVVVVVVLRERERENERKSPSRFTDSTKKEAVATVEAVAAVKTAIEAELKRVCTEIVVPIVGLEMLNELVFAASDLGTTLRKFDLQKVHCPLAVLITHYCALLVSAPPTFMFMITVEC